MKFNKIQNKDMKTKTPSQKKIASFKRQYEKLLAKFPDIMVGVTISEVLIAYDVKGEWSDKVSLPNTHTVKSEK